MESQNENKESLVTSFKKGLYKLTHILYRLLPTYKEKLRKEVHSEQKEGLEGLRNQIIKPDLEPINFDRPSELDTKEIEVIISTKHNYVEQFQELKEIQDSGIFSLLEDQFSQIAAVLAVEKHYAGLKFGTVSFEEIGKYAFGWTRFEDGQWVVRSNFDLIKKTNSNYREPLLIKIKRALGKELPKEIKRSLIIISIIHSLAHELYHYRQIIYFPNSLARRSVSYKFASSFRREYQDNFIEKGPNLFAHLYIDYLINKYREDKTSLLGKALGDYNNFREITQVDRICLH